MGSDTINFTTTTQLTPPQRLNRFRMTASSIDTDGVPGREASGQGFLRQWILQFDLNGAV